MQEGGDECVVCLENPRGTRLPCGHEILCPRCASKLLEFSLGCPLCRKKFYNVLLSEEYGLDDFVLKREIPKSKEDSQEIQRSAFSFPRLLSSASNLQLNGGCRVLRDVANLCNSLMNPNCLVTSLSLKNNFFGPTEVAMLCDALRNNTSVRTLCLAENPLGSEGVQILCEALEENRTIRELHLGSTQIGRKGAKFLAGLIKKNQFLEVLWVPENSLGNSGAKKIAQALCHNSTLRHLNMRSNGIGSEGLEYIRASVRSNKGLSFLDFGGNIDVNEKGVLRRFAILVSTPVPSH